MVAGAGSERVAMRRTRPLGEAGAEEIVERAQEAAVSGRSAPGLLSIRSNREQEDCTPSASFSIARSLKLAELKSWQPSSSSSGSDRSLQTGVEDANHETKHGSTPLHQNGTALPLEDSDAIGKVLLHPHVQVEAAGEVGRLGVIQSVHMGSKRAAGADVRLASFDFATNSSKLLLESATGAAHMTDPSERTVERRMRPTSLQSGGKLKSSTPRRSAAEKRPLSACSETGGGAKNERPIERPLSGDAQGPASRLENVEGNEAGSSASSHHIGSPPRIGTRGKSRGNRENNRNRRSSGSVVEASRATEGGSVNSSGNSGPTPCPPHGNQDSFRLVWDDSIAEPGSAEEVNHDAANHDAAEEEDAGHAHFDDSAGDGHHRGEAQDLIDKEMMGAAKGYGEAAKEQFSAIDGTFLPREMTGGASNHGVVKELVTPRGAKTELVVTPRGAKTELMLTPRGAKTELVALISEAFSVGHDTSTGSMFDESSSLSISGEKSLEAVSRAIVTVEMANMSRNPGAHFASLLLGDSGFAQIATGDCVQNKDMSGSGEDLLHKAMKLFNLAFPDYDGGGGDGGAGCIGSPVPTPLKAGPRLSGADIATSLRNKFQGSAELAAASPSNSHCASPSTVMSPAAACVVGSAKDLAAARVDSWNVSDFSMNLSIDSIRNLASVSGYCVPHSPTFLSPFGINMRISEAEQDSEILEEELFKAGAVGASNTQALPTVTEVSEDKTGVETYGETRVPGIGDASDFLRDVTVDMPHNELQEVGAREEEDKKREKEKEKESLPSVASKIQRGGWFLVARLLLVMALLSVALAGMALHLSPEKSQGERFAGLVLEVFGVPAFFMSIVGVAVECVEDDVAWIPLREKSPLLGRRIALNYAPFLMCIMAISIYGTKLSQDDAAEIESLGIVAMILASILPLPFIFVLSKHRKASRHGKGWFLGHPNPKTRVAVCVVVTLACGVVLLSSGMSGAFIAYSRAVQSSEENILLDGVVAASIILFVSGLSLAITAIVVGSGLDIRLVRDKYFTLCLPVMILSSAAIFFLVYCCLTLI